MSWKTSLQGLTAGLMALISVVDAQTRVEMALKVSPDGHSLIRRSDGAPVFLLGDTVWTLAHLIHRDDVAYYLENRRNQGFDMIFLSGVTEGGGLTANAMGDKPYRARPAATAQASQNKEMPTICPAESDPAVIHDFSQPLTTPGNDPSNAEAYDYWDHLDYIVSEAAKRSIYVALNPVVGTCYVRDGHVNTGNAEAIGAFFGKRYGSYGNLIWVLGGDIRADAAEDHLAIYRGIAKGIAQGATGSEDYSRLTMTYHPQGRTSSSTLLHGERWLTFNMQQTGQSDEAHYPSIAKDYALSPAKPVLDGEAWYEELPNRIRLGNRHATDFDVRKRAYWSVFAGSFGHIYGENSVMQFWAPGVAPYRDIPVIHWKQALFRPGATQLRHLRNLIESRPSLGRVPDQSVLSGSAEEFNDRRQATRGADYLFVYATSGSVVELQMGRISGERVSVWWFNPRDGSATLIGERANTGKALFQPPSNGIGQDWVLVVDDAAKRYPAPGKPLPTVQAGSLR
jgi:hypothetical protein